MQHLPGRLAAAPFRTHSAGVRARVRFLAYHRIKPHVPPLVRAPVNSFEADSVSPTAGVHRLPCGLPGYLILFDTRTFEHQRQRRAGRLPSRSEFFVISKHFTATPRIPPAPAGLKKGSFDRWPGLSPGILRPTCPPVYAPFKPNKSG